MENNKLYEKMCREILLGVCIPYRSDSLLDYNQGVEYTWKYEKYGLCIMAKDINEYRDELSDLSIYYEHILVYDKEKGIYITGIWEEILKELHKKLSVLIEKKEESAKRKKNCQKLLDEVILPITFEKEQEINTYFNSIEVKSYTKNSYRINNCGSYVDDYYFEVKEDGETVFKAVSESMFGSDCDILIYNPGFWELRLEYGLMGYKRKKDKEREEKGKEYIKQIRDIK